MLYFSYSRVMFTPNLGVLSGDSYRGNMRRLKSSVDVGLNCLDVNNNGVMTTS